MAGELGVLLFKTENGRHKGVVLNILGRLEAAELPHGIIQLTVGNVQYRQGPESWVTSSTG